MPWSLGDDRQPAHGLSASWCEGVITVYGQVVQGQASDPTAVRRAMGRWVRDVSPAVRRMVGITAGVTHDGEFVAVLLFDSEAARASSGGLEQDRWWADLRTALDGEATVRNGVRTEVFLAGDLGQAGFVQVVQGRVSDVDRALARMHALQEALEVHLPALLGSVTVVLAAGRFTRALCFTTEDAARAGEREMPPEVRARDQEARQLVVGPLEFLDLREPWSYAAR